MHRQAVSLEDIQKMKSLFPTNEALLAAADHYLGLIETTTRDPVYWPKEELAVAIRVLEVTATLRPAEPGRYQWIDIGEETRPRKPLNRMELALFQAKVIEFKTSDKLPADE